MRRRSHKRREMDVEYEEKKASLSLTQVRNLSTPFPSEIAHHSIRITFWQCWDPWHFCADPDLWIRTSDYWIRIQIRIRILSSLILRIQKKYFFFQIFFLLLSHWHIIWSLKNLIFSWNFVLKLNFAGIISVRSHIYEEKGRIWIRIRTSD
jgi:hypothetical protein